MNTIEICVLSAALGADLFSVALPIGMIKVDFMRTVKSSLVFAFFHIGMILAGYYAGHWLGSIIEHFGLYQNNLQISTVENIAKIIGTSVLILLGVYIILGKFSHNEDDLVEKCSYSAHPLRGMSLIMLATSVSIDALAAGFSMGMIDVDLLKLSVILGVIIFFISIAGLSLGRQIGRYIGDKAALAGGIILVALGLRVLYTLF